MRRFFFILLLPLISMPLAADTSGILKARLSEKEDGTLILEADVPAIQEGSLGAPVFPARYRPVEKVRAERLDLLTLGYEARPYGEGRFLPGDSLELPWAVNGISLTVFRRDGTVGRSLHKRGLTGISIPLDLVLPVKTTLREELRGWLLRLLGRRELILPSLLLALVLGGLYPPARIPGLWLVYFGCAAAALPFAEAGLRAPLLLFAGILNLFLILILSVRYGKAGEGGSDSSLILGITGFVSGLFCYGEFNAYSQSGGECAAYYILTLLMVSSTVILVALLLSFLRQLAGDPPLLKAVFIYTPATSAVFLILLLLAGPVRSGETTLLGEDQRAKGDPDDGAAIVLSQNSSTVLAYPDAPLSLFIAMDPYELRLEVLVRLSSLIREEDSLAAEEQGALLEDLEEELARDLSVEIDGEEGKPLRIEASFVQVMNNGIALRSEAVEESGEDGLIGVTLIYGSDEIPGSLRLGWDFFPPGIGDLPVRMAAPWEDRAFVLSLENREIEWEGVSSSALSPSVIPSAGLRLPVLSLVLFLAGLVILVFGRGKGTVLLPILLALALLFYPRVRLTLPGPLRLSAGSRENMVLILDGLLGNLYRSFELRDEGMVYDRLALTVEGEFLQEVFLQNRRAMILEERGGARARVEDVTMLSAEYEGPSEDGGIVVNARWTVSGAVSHFGHTHYRRNRYEGDVSLVRNGSSWRISGISLREEEREL